MKANHTHAAQPGLRHWISRLGTVLPVGARRRSGSSAQSGFTLVEILLSMAIGLILLVPVGGWMIMAMRQQGPTATRFSEASQARIANTYLSRDVGSAELVRTTGFGADPGCGTEAGDAVFLQLIDDSRGEGEAPLRTVYVTNTNGDGVTSVYRRTCRTSDTSVVEDQVHVLRDVVTSPSGPSATCTPATADPLTDCRQVTFTATLSGGAPVNVRAMRRATLDDSFLGTDGNFRPFARINEVSRGGVRPDFKVELDGSASGDIDGSVVSWKWTVSDPASVSVSDPNAKKSTFTFKSLGTYKVTLEVSDGIDSSTKVHTVVVENVAPTIAVSVTPNEGPVMGDGLEATFEFDTTGTFDAEGDGPLLFTWEFGDGVDPSSPALTGANPRVRFLAGAPLGSREVKLTVTDGLGAKSVSRVAIRLLKPDGSDPEPAQDIVIYTDGEPTADGDPGPLVSTPGRSQRAGTVGPGRPPVTVDFSTATTPPFTWELRRGATVVTSSTDASFSHAFGAADAGEWTVALIPDGGGTHATRTFRLNDAPVAAFSVSGSGSAPSSRSFDSAGSSDDSEIVARNWNFGFFDNWTSNLAAPTQGFSHPGAYTVTLVVTDDDGATSFKTSQLSVPGALTAPPAGSFTGRSYGWAAVPGAEEYSVHLEVTDAPGCTSSTGPQDYTIAATQDPALSTAYENCAVTAKHRLKVSGTWGPYSNAVVRP